MAIFGEDLPTIGHNAPPPPKPMTDDEIRAWLLSEFQPLTDRAAELAKALQASIDDVPTIENDEQMAAFADNMRMAQAWTKTKEARRTEAKAPFLTGGRAIDAWFRDIGEALTAPLNACQTAMNAYLARVAAERRRVAEAAAAQARREAEAAAAAAAAAAFAEREETLEADKKLAGQIETAQRAAGRAERAEDKADAKIADHVRSHTDLGTVVTGTERLEFDIIDEAKVPREFLVVDRNRVTAALRRLAGTPEDKADLRRKLEKGEQPIEGIAVRIEVKAGVR